MKHWLLPPKPRRLHTCCEEYEELLHHPDWIAEPKLDGHRLITKLNPNGATPRTRQGHPHLPATRALMGATYPTTLWLDGEWYEGVYHVFDIPYAMGLMLHQRRELLEQAVMKLGCHYPIQIMPRWDKLTAYAQAMSEGIEGIVLKNINHLYSLSCTQHHTPMWRKVKP